jgi:DNA modification methylase
MLEGFRFIGIEREPEYADIAEARIRWWARRPGADTAKALEAVRAEDATIDAGQMGLFGP